MAVPPDSSPTSPSKHVKSKTKNSSKTEPASPANTTTAKRTTNPGVRVIGGRIYDSEHGKTCHQCRQKTRDFAAACTKTHKNKPCPIHYCHKCLINRYGEKAEEVSKTDGWGCPKCRGVCNCSFCMKKKGHQPTGMLIHAAKATGCSSVLELLDRKEAGSVSAENAILERSLATKKGSVSRKRNSDMENQDDTQMTNPTLSDTAKNAKKKLSKKLKREGVNADAIECSGGVINKEDQNVDHKMDPALSGTTKKNRKKSSKKLKEGSNVDGIDCNGEGTNKEDKHEQKTDPALSVTAEKVRKKSSKKLKEGGNVDGIECNGEVTNKENKCDGQKTDPALSDTTKKTRKIPDTTKKARKKASKKLKKEGGDVDGLVCSREVANKENQHEQKMDPTVSETKEKASKKLKKEGGDVDGLECSGEVANKENQHEEKMDPAVSETKEKVVKKSSKKFKKENGNVEGLECNGEVATEASIGSPKKGVLPDSKKRKGHVVDSGNAEAHQLKVCKMKKQVADSADKVNKNVSENEIDLNFPLKEESPGDPEMGLLTDGSKDKPLPKVRKLRKCSIASPGEPEVEDVVLPHGTPLSMVAGVEFQEKDVGHALQFLEFCNAFSKVLGLKKGDAESLLRELARGHIERCGITRGRIGRRGIPPIGQFHIKLLAIIQKDIGETPISYSNGSSESWLQTLAKCSIFSECALKDLSLDSLIEGPLVYDDWDLSIKLKLLNLLCDEALCTGKLRNWIDNEHTKFLESRREVNEKIFSAKKREKEIKQKLKDDVAKALISSSEGAPLTISEHDNLLSRIKIETEKAHAETLESLNLLPKKKQRASAVRTEPMLLEGSGHVYWKLRSFLNSSNILLQDIGKWDSIVSSDKWLAHNEEEEKAIEKFATPLRRVKQKKHNIGEIKSLEIASNDEKQDLMES